MQYYAHCPGAVHSSASKPLLLLYAVMGFLCMAGAPVIWIITESMLVMYRFPLSTARAAGLVAGFYIQFGVLWLTGERASFAMFVTVYTTLLASLACILPLYAMAGKALASRIGRSMGKEAFGAALVLGLMVLVPPVALFPVLRQGFLGMTTVQLAVSIAVTAVNTIWTARELIDLSVFGAPDPREQEYTKEWERWAPPTVIMLILSVVAGIVIAGISRH